MGSAIDLNSDINHKMLETLPAALILFDLKRLYYVNKSAGKLLHIKYGEITDHSTTSVFSFLTETDVKKIIKGLVKEKAFFVAKLPLVVAGKTTHIDVSCNQIMYKGKKVVQCLLLPVTTGNHAETDVSTDELINQTRDKLDLITNYSNEIISFYTYFPEEKYLYVSPNIKKILGYSPSDLLKNKNFLEEKVKDKNEDFKQTDRLLRNYQKKGIVKTHKYFYKTVTKKNKEVWLENSFIPITNDKGKISFFLFITRDITIQKEKEMEIELQYTNYRNLLDNSPIAYIIHDHGVCLYVNKSLMELFKIKNKNYIIGKFILEFFSESDRKRVIRRISQLYSTEAAAEKAVNYKIKDLEGSEIEVEIKSVPIKFNNKDCIFTLVNNLSEKRQREDDIQKVITVEAANVLLQKEIKEKEEAEKSLMETTAHLSSIFESSTHMLWTVNKDYNVTSFNKNFGDVMRTQHGVILEPGHRVDEYEFKDKKEYTEFWYSRYDFAFKGRKLEFEKEDFYGGKVFRKVFINPIYNNKNEVTELSCIANDITDSKIYEQKLLSQTGKLTAIFDSSHHYIWTINQEEKLTSFNKNYYDLITSLYNTKPYVGLVLDRGVLANDKEYTMLLKHHYHKAFNGIATSFEIETRDQEYKNVYLEIFLNPIYENEKVVEVSGIAHDITEKKHVQQRMEVSLKEKEILLREVHHRVKNNMQVISSILNLQSSYVSDEYTLNLLKESQNRIKTMAYIHESLYQNKSFTSVNFSDYVHTLVNNIVQSYSYSSDKILLEINIENMTLSLDSSIPAGLIINELITNAIKHAFPGTKKGTITFNLRCENKLVILELKDDGVGFAQGIDFENSHSLGLQLVNTLAEQIDGNIKFKSEKNQGTEVIVTFKM